MSKLRRVVLLRHGDTVGESRTRFHGSSDVVLSDEGRAQVRTAAHELRREMFDLAIASPLRRSWESAVIATGGAPVRLEPDFREIDFGRWEGMTAEEIEASDPVLYRDWQARRPGFEFPSGELRSQFRDRVLRGYARLANSGAASALVVVHKGVVRTIAEHLLGAPLEEGIPELAHGVGCSRNPDGSWHLGRRSSNPQGIGDAA